MNRAFPLFVDASAGSRACCCASFATRSSIATFRSSPRSSLLGGVGGDCFQRRREQRPGSSSCRSRSISSRSSRLLAGASSAQAERDEWQMLFAQPVPRAGLCGWQVHCLPVDLRRGPVAALSAGLLAGSDRRTSRAALSARLSCWPPSFLPLVWPPGFSRTIARRRSSPA